MGGGNDFILSRIRRCEFGQRNDFETANDVERFVLDEDMLGETDRNCAVGLHAIRIGLRGVTVETGRKIDRKYKRVFFAPQSIDLSRAAANGFPQKPACSNPE